jgi:multiple sugar transport system permease protein
LTSPATAGAAAPAHATVALAQGAPARPARVRRRRIDAFPYLLLLPAAAMMVLVNLVPILEGLRMSMLKLNQYTLNQFLGAPFVGLANYRSVLFDAESPVHAGMVLALRNTALYAILVTACAVALGLGVALLLHRDFPGRTLARTLLMLPWVVPTYVVGTLWGFMWQRDEGIVNHLLVDVLHLLDHKPFWLIGGNTFFAIVIPTVWRAWPVLMLVFLAALQAVPEELYEAAKLDGANAWQRFRHITLPALAPVILIQVMFQVIDNVYAYNIVAMMFGKGAGYPGEWGDLLMPLLTRQSFSYWRFGEGAAVSFVMMAVMLVFVGVWLRVFRARMTSDA